MALNRFPVKRYATLELNQAQFLRDGMIISQMPLDPMFTQDKPCENGMWVWANKANGVMKPVEADTDLIGIVYTTEKEYNQLDIGMNTFALWGQDGFYPRVGIVSTGDTMTTNCFQYDTAEFATVALLETALKAWATAPVYVIPVPNDPVPQVTLSLPATGTYAQVTKYYTVPNGEKGIKYQFVKVRH